VILNPDEPTSRSRVAAAYRTAMIIALALTGGIVLYMVIGLIILRSASAVSREELLIPFYGGAAVFALGALAFRRIQMQGVRLESVAARSGITGLIGHLVTTTLISGALVEVIGILGLMLSLLSGDVTHVIRLGVVALAVSVYNFPRLRPWQQAVEYFEQTAAAVMK
jgi:F0F1-type ATP synthase membrane subunit c/vacuolar-type H+-ATPase subunit K